MRKRRLGFKTKFTFIVVPQVSQNMSCFIHFTFLFTDNEFSAQAESLITIFKSRITNNLSELLALVRVTLFQSEVQHGLHYESFFFNGSWLINPNLPAPPALNVCACSVTHNCPQVAGHFFCINGNNCTANTAVWTVPGIVAGCTATDDTLLSDFRCFYNQTCLNTVLSMYNVDMPDRLPLPAATLAIQALNSSAPSHYVPEDTFLTIFSQLMVEKWEIQSNFTGYYGACAPISCTYVSVQRLNMIGILTTIVSLIGGLTVSLRLLITISGRFIYFVISYWHNRNAHRIQRPSVTNSSMKIHTT